MHKKLSKASAAKAPKAASVRPHSPCVPLAPWANSLVVCTGGIKRGGTGGFACRRIRRFSEFASGYLTTGGTD